MMRANVYESCFVFLNKSARNIIYRSSCYIQQVKLSIKRVRHVSRWSWPAERLSLDRVSLD